MTITDTSFQSFLINIFKYTRIHSLLFIIYSIVYIIRNKSMGTDNKSNFLGKFSSLFIIISIFISCHYVSYIIILFPTIKHYSFLFIIDGVSWLLSVNLIFFNKIRRIKLSFIGVKGFWVVSFLIKAVDVYIILTNMNSINTKESFNKLIFMEIISFIIMFFKVLLSTLDYKTSLSKIIQLNNTNLNSTNEDDINIRNESDISKFQVLKLDITEIPSRKIDLKTINNKTSSFNNRELSEVLFNIKILFKYYNNKENQIDERKINKKNSKLKTIYDGYYNDDSSYNSNNSNNTNRNSLIEIETETNIFYETLIKKSLDEIILFNEKIIDIYKVQFNSISSLILMLEEFNKIGEIFFSIKSNLSEISNRLIESFNNQGVEFKTTSSKKTLHKKDNYNKSDNSNSLSMLVYIYYMLSQKFKFFLKELLVFIDLQHVEITIHNSYEQKKSINDYFSHQLTKEIHMTNLEYDIIKQLYMYNILLTKEISIKLNYDSFIYSDNSKYNSNTNDNRHNNNNNNKYIIEYTIRIGKSYINESVCLEEVRQTLSYFNIPILNELCDIISKIDSIYHNTSIDNKEISLINVKSKSLIYSFLERIENIIYIIVNNGFLINNLQIMCLFKVYKTLKINEIQERPNISNNVFNYFFDLISEDNLDQLPKSILVSEIKYSNLLNIQFKISINSHKYKENNENERIININSLLLMSITYENNNKTEKSKFKLDSSIGNLFLLFSNFKNDFLLNENLFSFNEYQMNTIIEPLLNFIDNILDTINSIKSNNNHKDLLYLIELLNQVLTSKIYKFCLFDYKIREVFLKNDHSLNPLSTDIYDSEISNDSNSNDNIYNTRYNNEYNQESTSERNSIIESLIK